MPNWLDNKANRSILFLTGGVLVVSAICIWGVYTFVGKDNVLSWLLNDENRELITWIGSGFGVIVIVLWIVFTYFNKPSPTSGTPAASITTGDNHNNEEMNNIEKAKQKKAKGQ